MGGLDKATTQPCHTSDIQGPVRKFIPSFTDQLRVAERHWSNQLSPCLKDHNKPNAAIVSVPVLVMMFDERIDPVVYLFCLLRGIPSTYSRQENLGLQQNYV